VPAVSLSAARAADGSIELALVNLSPKTDVPLAINVVGSKQSHVHGEILTASTMDAHNTFTAPQAVQPTAFSGAKATNGTLTVTLPAKSVVVLRLE